VVTTKAKVHVLGALGVKGSNTGDERAGRRDVRGLISEGQRQQNERGKVQGSIAVGEKSFFNDGAWRAGLQKLAGGRGASSGWLGSLGRLKKGTIRDDEKAVSEDDRGYERVADYVSRMGGGGHQKLYVTQWQGAKKTTWKRKKIS